MRRYYWHLLLCVCALMFAKNFQLDKLCRCVVVFWKIGTLIRLTRAREDSRDLEGRDGLVEFCATVCQLCVNFYFHLFRFFAFLWYRHFFCILFFFRSPVVLMLSKYLNSNHCQVFFSSCCCSVSTLPTVFCCCCASSPNRGIVPRHFV